MRRSIAVVSMCLLVTFVTSTSGPAVAQSGDPVVLTVMTFNIWYGATPTDGLDEVMEAIELAGADVVGMQEPYARLRRIADALGFYSRRGCT